MIPCGTSTDQRSWIVSSFYFNAFARNEVWLPIVRSTLLRDRDVDFNIDWMGSSSSTLPCSLRSCCGECSVNTLSLWLPLRYVSLKWPGTGSSDPYALLHQESAISLFRFSSLFVTNIQSNLALERYLSEQIRTAPQLLHRTCWSLHSFDSYPSKSLLKRILGLPTWIKPAWNI